jgi:Dockerin type I domain/PEP-CTERM motif
MVNSQSPVRQWPLVIVVFAVIVYGCAVDRAYGLVFVGDFNLDGQVDSRDIVKMEYVLTNPIVLFDEYCAAEGLSISQATFLADVNGDGQFNNADLQALNTLLLDGGGQTSTVPEPSSCVLLALGTLGLMIRHRQTSQPPVLPRVELPKCLTSP